MLNIPRSFRLSFFAAATAGISGNCARAADSKLPSGNSYFLKICPVFVIIKKCHTNAIHVKDSVIHIECLHLATLHNPTHLCSFFPRVHRRPKDDDDAAAAASPTLENFRWRYLASDFENSFIWVFFATSQ